MINTYSNGYWGRWESAPNYSWKHTTAQGSVDNFIVYDDSSHPSKYAFKLEVIGMNEDLKANKWYEYRGTLSFDENYTWEDFALYEVVNIPVHFYGVQRKSVKVMVMKDSSGYIYNIISGNTGFAITIPWRHAKPISK